MKHRLQLLSIILICFLFVSSAIYHKYYVSVTKVEYSKKDKAIQIISQVFIDDFENMLNGRYDNNITQGEEYQAQIPDRFIEEYYISKFIIKLNNKQVNYTYLGKEYKDDMIFTYLEIEDVVDIKSLSITNKLLFDMYPEQQNIVRTSVLDKKKSFILNSTNPKAVLNFAKK